MSTFKLKRKPGDRGKKNYKTTKKRVQNGFSIDKLPDKNLTKIHASSGVNEW